MWASFSGVSDITSGNGAKAASWALSIWGLAGAAGCVAVPGLSAGSLTSFLSQPAKAALVMAAIRTVEPSLFMRLTISHPNAARQERIAARGPMNCSLPRMILAGCRFAGCRGGAATGSLHRARPASVGLHHHADDGGKPTVGRLAVVVEEDVFGRGLVAVVPPEDEVLRAGHGLHVDRPGEGHDAGAILERSGGRQVRVQDAVRVAQVLAADRRPEHVREGVAHRQAGAPIRGAFTRRDAPLGVEVGDGHEG